MKTCPFCQKRNKPTAKKCAGCGASFGSTHSVRVSAVGDEDDAPELAAELEELSSGLAEAMSVVPQVEKLLRKGKVEEATQLYQQAVGCSRKQAEKSIKSILAGE